MSKNSLDLNALPASLNLDAFRKIANGTHNVGEIVLNAAGTGLAKVNNHVYKTSQNNVRLTAEQNRQVRDALYKALSEKIKDDDILYEIGLQLFGDGRENCSLSRDYVRHLINAADTKQLEMVQDAGEIGKRLLDRNISVKDAKVNDKVRLVKSQKDEAYKLTVNEKIEKEILSTRQKLRIALKGEVSCGFVMSFRKKEEKKTSEELTADAKKKAVEDAFGSIQSSVFKLLTDLGKTMKTRVLINTELREYFANLIDKGEVKYDDKPFLKELKKNILNICNDQGGIKNSEEEELFTRIFPIDLDDDIPTYQ